MPMSGRHTLSNALAAAAVATAFDLTTDQIAAALQTATPPKMRGEVIEFAAGFTVIHDSYNSNPRSLINMVRTIAEGGKSRKRLIVVAGEMLELGPEEAELHRQACRDMHLSGLTMILRIHGLSTQSLH